MTQVFPIPAFQDNYIWCIHSSDYCVVVDPGDASPVIEFLNHHNLQLSGILVTHHHHDHVGGINALTNLYDDIPVWGSERSRVQEINHPVAKGATITLPKLGCSLRVLEIPGHTLDHIGFYGDIGLFCGDTLFSAGCGRIFEGSPKQMFDSLNLLSALPANTQVFCTHEYTLANITFAQEVEPNNQALAEYANWAIKTRRENKPTLPTSIEQQQAINPFLRSTEPDVVASVKRHAKLNSEQPELIFSELRRWKDSY